MSNLQCDEQIIAMRQLASSFEVFPVVHVNLALKKVWQRTLPEMVMCYDMSDFCTEGLNRTSWPDSVRTNKEER